MRVVLELVSLRHEQIFLDMVADFLKGDRATLLSLFDLAEWSPESFKKFVKTCDSERMDWRPGPGKTSISSYLLIDQGSVCGFGRLRFPLPEGDPTKGNLEFYVPPSKRGSGYGALTLNRLLFEAVRAGLARALVVCETRNGAANRCIERNRGELTKDGSDKEYSSYWIRFR